MSKDMRSEGTKQGLVSLMQELMAEHPDWRFGQLVANIAFLARQTNAATYDVDDAEFLQAGRAHLQKMKDRHQVAAQVHEQLKELAAHRMPAAA